MKNNVNPLPGIFGNVTPAEMERITELYKSISVLTDHILIKNKKALASVGSTRKGK